MSSIVASAPTKVIITGEHAVVYDYPAVACAVSKRIYVKISPCNEGQIVFSEGLNLKADISKEVPSEFEPIKRIVDILNVRTPFKCEIISDVPPACGLGTSAAVAVAFTKALSTFIGIELDNTRISSIAYEAEKITHGKPSGIDNTLATFGGAILYRKSVGFRRKDVPNIKFIVVDSGQKRRTRDAVFHVKKLLESNREFVTKIFERISEISKTVWNILDSPDFQKMGELLNENHELLKMLGLSTDKIEMIVKIAKDMNCYAAKITGAGMGGMVLVLPPQDNRGINKILASYRKNGFYCFELTLTNDGVRIE